MKRRLIAILNGIEQPKPWKWLETQTGIKRQRWANLAKETAKPTLEEMEKIQETFPEYREWLLTGTGTPPKTKTQAQKYETETLKGRLIYILNAMTRRDRWTWLENKTKIDRRHWTGIVTGTSKGYAEDIEGILKAFPEYAEWIIFGTGEPPPERI